MSLPELPLLSVTERDVDLLLLEELTVSPDFGHWFGEQVDLDLSGSASLVGAWHSVSDPTLGESDLLVIWRDSAGSRIALLVEDKIDAPAQPEQGRRYQLRGEAGIEAGDWDCFQTVMVAPARYLEASREAGIYGRTISYESITEFLISGDSPAPRSAYRASVLLSAIEQQRRGYSPVIDAHVTEFWLKFWMLSRERCPRLGMASPGPKPRGAGWIWAPPPELGGRQWIAFKLLLGIVDLQIDGAADQVDRIDAICAERLGRQVAAVVTGKSTSLRLEVDPVDILADFENQRAAIELVFDAANQLLDAWKTVGGEIRTG